MFQGASYFRAVGKGQSYGLSARGLAVDTAAADGRGVPALRRVLDRAAARQRHLADDLRAARLASRRRRLSLRADAGRRDDDAGDGAPLPARDDRQARPRAADEHVHLRREPAGPRRLPARGARLRRPVDPARRRRVDLAAARQSAPPARHLVRHDQPARLRPDAARPLARELRGSRRRSTSGGRARGSSRSATGAPAASSWCRSRRPTRPTTTSSPSGCRRRCRRPASRSTSPTRSTGRPRARCLPARAGSCRRGAAAALPRRPTATSSTSSTSTVRRCVRSPRRADVEPVIWVDANAEVRERNLFKNPVSGAWRMTVRIQAQRCRQAGRVACLPEATTVDTDRDMELHPSRRGGQAVTPPVPHPPLERSSMPAVPWAGSPWRRPLRRLLGRLPRCRGAAPATPGRSWRAGSSCSSWSCSAPSSARRRWPRCCPSAARRSPSAACSFSSASSSRWISAGFWTGVMGAGVLLFGRGKSPLMRGLRERAAAPARPRRAHGDRHADLQRARADRLRRPRGDDRFAASRPASRRTSTSTS